MNPSHTDIKVHGVTFALTRVGLCPDLLYRRNIRPSIMKAINTGRILKIPPGTFLRGVGPVIELPQPTTPPAFEVKYNHSRLRTAPLYVPVNWRIVATKLDQGLLAVFRARVRLFAHGGYTVAL